MTAGRTVSGISQDWCTPPKYVEAIQEFFGGVIELDPCSNEHSVVGAEVEWRAPKTDALSKEWNFKTIFVNPPYGADRERGTTIRDWLRKCAKTHADHESEVLALVPVATNTRHWKLHVWGAATAVSFLYDTRLRFLVAGRDEGKGAPMSCAMVYWGPNYRRFEEVFLKFGAVIDLRHLHDKDVGPHERRNLLLPFK